MEAGLSIYPEFRIDKSNKSMYNLLMGYFLRRENLMFQKLDYKKGLLIMGDIGTGKSILVKSFCKIVPNLFYESSRIVVREFMADGSKALDKYGRFSFQKKIIHGREAKPEDIDRNTPIAYCFDDLGLESSDSQIFGNRANVLAEILLDRYEERLITHATTNLNVEKLEEMYGNRLRDRFKEMFNIVRLTGKSLRK